MANVSTLIGVIVDVSWSMKTNIDDTREEKPGKWIDSVIQVIDDLIKHDVSASNHVFAIGVGENGSKKIFDVISTLDSLLEKKEDTSYIFNLSFDETIDRVLEILQSEGAKYVRNWAEKDTIKSVTSEKMAKKILRQLETNKKFVKKFVNDFLPEVCKNGIKLKQAAYAGVIPALFLGGPVAAAIVAIASHTAVKNAESVVSSMRPATKKEIQEVVKKATAYLFVKAVSDKSSYFNVKEAHRIVHGCVDEEELTARRRKELLDAVEPYIYGCTPMYKALRITTHLFSFPSYIGHKKLLFILSDGDPTDSGNQLILKDTKISVVSCFITRANDIEPKRLYSKVDGQWDTGAKFLFNLSSTLSTQLVPRTIFIKRGWKIDIANNETRLFLQVNHPDHVKDACDLARNVVCCQDTLADMLSNVDLHIYINQTNIAFPAPYQDEDTCYANASAAIVHLATKRILGRSGGYPDFDELRQDFIMRYGRDGSNTLRVLREVCTQYRLQFREVDIVDALRAITDKRPVVATFRLTQREWNVFNTFFGKHTTGILSSKEIDVKNRSYSENTIGHAVILTSFNSECLRFMNTWGMEWGDQGFFRVQKAGILGFKFIDVFWKKGDLYQSEKDYYEKHGSEVAETLMKRLKGLQSATYQCPLCRATSLVTEFSGTLLHARCPKCLQEFKGNDQGNILALNVYLTSLSK